MPINGLKRGTPDGINELEELGGLNEKKYYHNIFRDYANGDNLTKDEIVSKIMLFSEEQLQGFEKNIRLFLSSISYKKAKIDLSLIIQDRRNELKTEKPVNGANIIGIKSSPDKMPTELISIIVEETIKDSDKILLEVVE